MKLKFEHLNSNKYNWIIDITNPLATIVTPSTGKLSDWRGKQATWMYFESGTLSFKTTSAISFMKDVFDRR